MSHRRSLTAFGHGARRWLTDPRAALHGAANVPAPPGRGAVIDWPATLCAKGAAALTPRHLRHRATPARQAQLQLLLLDTSGSMQRHGALARAKGWALQLIEHAARGGDAVAVLGFGGQGVQVLLAPQPARRAAGARLRQLGGGGGTPLAQALRQAEAWARGGGLRQRACAVNLWLLTDGRCPEVPHQRPAGLQALHIVDFDDPLAPRGQAWAWARRWQAQWRAA
jgi:magnesium chelatase subunit ChlD-like protein